MILASREQVEAVSRVLKQRFNNLSAEQLINLSFDVLNALVAADPKLHKTDDVNG